MKFKAAFCAAIAFATIAHAKPADLVGQWDGVLSTQDGDFKITYVFTSADDKISGTVKSEWGDFPMADLKVDGDSLTFRVETDNGTYTNKGSLADGALTVMSTGPQGDLKLTLKRPAAQTVSGRWHTKIQGPDGDVDLVFVMKPDGDALNGTVTSAMGESPFKNGRISGDSLSFDTEYDGMKISHVGKMQGDTITLQVKSEAWEIPMTLTREVAQKK